MSTALPSPSSVDVRRSGRRRLVPLAAIVALGAAGCGGSGGGGGGDDEVQRKVVTTDAGTIIVRADAEPVALRVEVQDSSVYVTPTDGTPKDVLTQMRGKPLGGRCTLKDGRTIGTIQLLWRESSGDWGSNLEVQGVYDEKTPLPEAVRSCELRRGVAAGAGATDVNAGPVLTTATFTDD